MQQEIVTLDSVTYDRDLYGGTDRDVYVTSIPVHDEDDANNDAMNSEVVRKLSYTAPKNVYDNLPRGGADEHNSSGFLNSSRKIFDREDDYRRWRLNRVFSPDRHDAFAAGEKTPDPSVMTYADAMRQQALEREEEETLKAIAKKKEEEEAAKAEGGNKGRNGWDQSQDGDAAAAKKAKAMPDALAPAPGIGRCDATPTPGRVSDASLSAGRRNRWDETPTPGHSADADATPAGGATPGAMPAGLAWEATPKGLATPTPKRQLSRWDETTATMGSATPLAGATPAAAYKPGVTPVEAINVATPTLSAINLRGAIMPEQYNLLRWDKDIEERNRPLTDDELDTMFPLEGYKQFDVPKEAPGGLPFMKPEDYQYFGALLNEDEEELSPDEQKERKIMKLLLKVKNGTPPEEDCVEAAY
ncbi:hypothetical protein LWI29_008764 [Acer saccharum]|uniref:Splicing factor 3B subunit 1 domain-containing protein n=1 Tax=Acer saccharum TaxID=4024 RepID=A0AA39SU03_ACESA|nr:hypothetical protein LWI29_008764 [Acer saccharum]